MNSELAISLSSSTWDHGLAYSTAAWVHAGQGRFELAETRLREAQEIVHARPYPFGFYHLAMAQAVLAQARGDAEALRAAVTPILDGQVQPILEGRDRWGWHVLVLEGLLGTGDLDSARSRLAALADLAEAYGLWSPRTDLARLSGQLSEASDDPHGALAAYAAGVQSGRQLPLPAARLELAYGSLLRRTGARRAGIEQLRAAHTRLTALGAEPFLQACEAELAACGLQTPSVDQSGRLDLTPAEQAVAHLIAQGLTNREAATRLYVSTKTVEYHLGHIYAKLGIKSRRELSDRLPPQGGDVSGSTRN